MMKKLCAVIFLFLIFSSLAGCADRYAGWQEVHMSYYGTFKVPPEWTWVERDGFLYFAIGDKMGTKEYVMVQYSSDKENNDYFSDIENSDISGTDEAFSNSTLISKVELSYHDGTKKEVYGIWFDGSNGLVAEYICLDSAISKETIKKIANSYSMDD